MDYKLTYLRAYKIALKIVRNRETAEEVAQETCLKVWQDVINGKITLDLKHRVIDAVRKIEGATRRNKNYGERKNRVMFKTKDEQDALLNNIPAPEIEEDHLMRSLYLLDERQRRVMILLKLGLSNQEIAEELQVSAALITKIVASIGDIYYRKGVI